MADTDRTIITHLDEARFGSVGLATAPNLFTSAPQQLHQRHIGFDYSVAETAGGAIDLGVLYTDRTLLVLGFVLIPGVAVTASNTNYKTISLKYDNGAGGSQTTIWSATTQTTAATTGLGLGSLVVNTAVASSYVSGLYSGNNGPGPVSYFSAANVLVAANSMLHVTGAVTGTGVVIGPFGGHILVQEV